MRLALPVFALLATTCAVAHADEAALAEKFAAMTTELAAVEEAAKPLTSAAKDRRDANTLGRRQNTVMNELFSFEAKTDARWRPLVERCGALGDAILERSSGKPLEPVAADDRTRQGIAILDQVEKDQQAQGPGDHGAQLVGGLNRGRAALMGAGPRARRSGEWIDNLVRLDVLRDKIRARAGEAKPVTEPPAKPPVTEAPAKPPATEPKPPVTEAPPKPPVAATEPPAAGGPYGGAPDKTWPQGPPVAGTRVRGDEFEERLGLANQVWATGGAASASYKGYEPPASVVGPPQLFPRSEADSPKAWATPKPTSTEWLEVTFPPTPTTTICILESGAPATVQCVIDAEGTVLYRSGPESSRAAGALVIELPAARTITGLRVWVKGRGGPYYPGIDAVGLSTRPLRQTAAATAAAEVSDPQVVAAKVKEIQGRFPQETWNGELATNYTVDDALAWLQRCKDWLAAATPDELFLQKVQDSSPIAQEPAFRKYYNWFTNNVHYAGNTKDFGIGRRLAYVRGRWKTLASTALEYHAGKTLSDHQLHIEYPAHLERATDGLVGARALLRLVELFGGDAGSAAQDLPRLEAIVREIEDGHTRTVREARLPAPVDNGAEVLALAREAFKGARGHRITGRPTITQKERQVGNQVEMRKYHLLEVAMAVQARGRWWIEYGTLGRPLYFDSEKPAGPYEFWSGPGGVGAEILEANIDEVR